MSTTELYNGGGFEVVLTVGESSKLVGDKCRKHRGNIHSREYDDFESKEEEGGIKY